MRVFAPLALALLGGCSMTPEYRAPPLPVPASWPIGDATLVANEADLPAIGYRDAIRDARLLALIETAIANNRDLRIAAANIAAARAMYRIQRAERLPEIGAGASADIADGNSDRYSVDIGVTAFELDLFGRVAALTDVEQQRYFATEAGARATRIALIADIAEVWTNRAADAARLRIARSTAANAARTIELTRARLVGGVAPRTDLRQAEQILATAEADVADLTTALAQHGNALQLLIGAPVDPILLPDDIDDADTAFAAVPAGIDSRILLRRPDILQTEYELRAANASIGAARAAMFPRISLTGLLGFASTALGGLFDGGAFAASAGADARATIFAGGARRADVALTEAQRDAALAAYERAIQSGFREVSDALARRATIEDAIAANEKRVAAATDTAQLTDARYRGGVASFLESLDAQRALYSAERQRVAIRAARAANLIALYRTLAADAPPQR